MHTLPRELLRNRLYAYATEYALRPKHTRSMLLHWCLIAVNVCICVALCTSILIYIPLSIFLLPKHVHDVIIADSFYADILFMSAVLFLYGAICIISVRFLHTTWKVLRREMHQERAFSQRLSILLALLPYTSDLCVQRARQSPLAETHDDRYTGWTLHLPPNHNAPLCSVHLHTHQHTTYLSLEITEQHDTTSPPTPYSALHTSTPLDHGTHHTYTWNAPPSFAQAARELHDIVAPVYGDTTHALWDTVSPARVDLSNIPATPPRSGEAKRTTPTLQPANIQAHRHRQKWQSLGVSGGFLSHILLGAYMSDTLWFSWVCNASSNLARIPELRWIFLCASILLSAAISLRALHAKRLHILMMQQPQHDLHLEEHILTLQDETLSQRDMTVSLKKPFSIHFSQSIADDQSPALHISITQDKERIAFRVRTQNNTPFTSYPKLVSRAPEMKGTDLDDWVLPTLLWYDALHNNTQQTRSTQTASLVKYTR